MKYSFVIPAHDEEALLPQTLASIRASAEAVGEPFELIVVDDASEDGTAAVAEQYGARVVRVEHRQISRTRNSGAAAASGDVLIFVDADTTIDEAVLRGVGENIAAGAIGGGAAVAFEGDVPLYGRLSLPLFLFLYQTLAGLAAGCFVYCTREAFDAVGGFDEELFASEEIWISQAIKEQGKFALIKAPVMTSGRKLRTHSFWELLCILARFTFTGGTRSLKKRDHLDLWYGPRREDAEG